MSDIVRSNFPDDLKAIVTKTYGDLMASTPLLVDSICTRMSVNDAYEIFNNKTNMGVMQEVPELGTFPADSMQQLYRATVHIKKYGIAARVSMESIEDNKAMDLAARIGTEFNKSYHETLNIQAAALLNNAFDSNYVYADGVELLSAAHSERGIVQSNKLAVDSDLSESALEEIIHMLHTTTDSRGKYGMIKAEKIVVHPTQQHEAARILRGVERYATADRDINANKELGYYSNEIVMSPNLTDTDAFYVITDQNRDNNGLIFLERKPFSITSDSIITVQGMEFYGVARHQFWANDWRAVFGSPGAA